MTAKEGSLEIEILLTPGCPHGEPTTELVRRVAASLVPGAEVQVRQVRGLEEALTLAFPGSPTVRVNGVDLEGAEAGPPAFACRRYGVEGVPPSWLVEAGVLRALRPRHVLMLCVANSARSQMAEGLARSLAPAEVRISSAGSAPSRIRPEALRVLEEVGIDATHQRAKGMEEIEGEVEAVITLCAEEVCPAWLGKAWRVHWGLPDPAAVGGSETERLRAFREIRDELGRRLSVMFTAPTPR